DTSLTFGSQPVNSISQPSAANLRNLGSATLNASLAASGDFAETDNCASVPGGGTCTINVTFKPTVSGTRTGAITITANAGGSPAQVGLSGTALDAAFAVLSTANVQFA